ncbi:DUF3857 and transglutaminase domain-containing protein [Flavisolibacter ginsenosidimutans]|nr:DUF3857 domain-containing protein [Flavisolibacter ginsenosidimutans]
MDLKECPFDKSADAVVLLDQAVAGYDDQYKLITDHRVRIKVLKQKGVEQGNVVIPYYSANGYEYLINISAVVITPGENGSISTSVLDEKQIFNRKVSSLYSTYTFALPNVKVGSIIDYKYQSIKRRFANVRRWEFQSDLPVMTSSFELAPMANSEFAYSVHKSAEYPIQIVPDKANGKYRFVMHDIPGLRNEVYTASTESFLQRVNFQFASYTDYYGKQSYMSTWDELTKDLLLDESFGSQANKNLSGSPLIKELPSTFSPTEKLKAIYDYVRSNFVWNGINSKYCEDGVKSVLEKKKGTTGDINLLLVALLKSAGLDAYPLLASERDNGRIDTTYSFLDQFNKVVALVNCEGRQYVLDGSNGRTPFFMVPSDLLNTAAYLVEKKRGRFVYFTNLPHRLSEGVMLAGSVTKDGELRGSAVVESRDYAKLQKEARYKSDTTRYRDALLKRNSFLKIDSFSVEGLKNDSLALRQETGFHYALKKSGDYYLLNANLFTGFAENPFTTQYRFTDIDFGAKFSSTVTGTFELPANFTTEPLPQNKKLVSPDRSMSISRIIEKRDNILYFKLIILIDREAYKADEYDTVKAFFNEMVDLLNEPVLLKSN